VSQVLNMRYPKELLKRIDEFKERKGFTTRTQTIIYLIQYALEQSDNRGDSSPTYSLGYRPSHSLRWESSRLKTIKSTVNMSYRIFTLLISSITYP